MMLWLREPTTNSTADLLLRTAVGHKTGHLSVRAYDLGKPLCLLCAEAGWLILVNAWLRLERAYLKTRLFLGV